MRWGIISIIRCKVLRIKFPSTSTELTNSDINFQSLSHNCVLKGCVESVYGWLCSIKAPYHTKVENVRAYFSGHYGHYGFNVQERCDSIFRFVDLSITSPGGTNDHREFDLCELKNVVKQLRKGLCVVVDNSYTVSNTLLTPYSGKDKNYKDTFNFYLSQLLIRIEQAFWLLVNKWRIFDRDLGVDLDNVPDLIHATCSLHNYCINER